MSNFSPVERGGRYVLESTAVKLGRIPMIRGVWCRVSAFGSITELGAAGSVPWGGAGLVVVGLCWASGWFWFGVRISLWSWVGEASVFGFEILRRPPERLCTKNTWREHCMLTGSGVRYRSAGKSKWKFRLSGGKNSRGEQHGRPIQVFKMWQDFQLAKRTERAREELQQKARL